MSGPGGSPFIQVSASGQQIQGGIELSLSVPQGVLFLDSGGDWQGCAQSGQVITCQAATAKNQVWSGSISTMWAAGSRGTVTARVTGMSASGRSAAATAASAWPP
jgi:hypothetical protein